MHYTPIELDTTQDESSTTQKASDEDSSLICPYDVLQTTRFQNYLLQNEKE